MARNWRKLRRKTIKFTISHAPAPAPLPHVNGLPDLVPTSTLICWIFSRQAIFCGHGCTFPVPCSSSEPNIPENHRYPLHHFLHTWTARIAHVGHRCIIHQCWVSWIYEVKWNLPYHISPYVILTQLQCCLSCKYNKLWYGIA